MRRHHITLGAATTAGGRVVSASSMISICGNKVALEGDQIMCPSCKSMGEIRCVPPRLEETCNGKPIALEDDLCICGCPNPPKLKAIQRSDYQSNASAWQSESDAESEE